MALCLLSKKLSTIFYQSNNIETQKGKTHSKIHGKTVTKLTNKPTLFNQPKDKMETKWIGNVNVGTKTPVRIAASLVSLKSLDYITLGKAQKINSQSLKTVDTQISLNKTQSGSSAVIEKAHLFDKSPLTTIPECHYYLDGKCVKSVTTLTNDDQTFVQKETMQEANVFIKGGVSYLDNKGNLVKFNRSAIENQHGKFIIEQQDNNTRKTSQWLYIPSKSTCLKATNLLKAEVFTITYTIRGNDGTERNIQITLKDSNHIPIIIGKDKGSVTEDTPYFGCTDATSKDNILTTAGKLTIIDADINESNTRFMFTKNNMSDFTISTDGVWLYRANNSHPTIQGLKNNQTISEIFTVSTFDGTPYNITISIHGKDDVPTITGNTVNHVIKDPASPKYIAFGNLNIIDADEKDAYFEKAMYQGKYGNLTINPLGNYYYLAHENQTAIQNAFQKNKTLTDCFLVATKDGTLSDIQINLANSTAKNELPNMKQLFNNLLVTTAEHEGNQTLVEICKSINDKSNLQNELCLQPQIANKDSFNCEHAIASQTTDVATETLSIILEVWVKFGGVIAALGTSIAVVAGTLVATYKTVDVTIKAYKAISNYLATKRNKTCQNSKERELYLTLQQHLQNLSKSDQQITTQNIEELQEEAAPLD